jgi:hypothetical protein
MNDLQGNPKSRNHPIRHSQKVQYLDAKNNEPLVEGITNYIFEAQLSVQIAGVDDKFWTAYCFADIHFQARSQADSAEYYYQNGEGRRDPHTGGKESLHDPTWDARTYFLKILASRFAQIQDEWTNVISQLLHHIEPYVCL